MQSKTFSDALLSPNKEVAEAGTKIIIKSMPEDLWFGLRNKTSFVFEIQNNSEYEDLMASVLNFPIKPTPASIQDRISAAKQVNDASIKASILNLLKTTSTHVMKAVNSKYEPLTIIDTSPLLSPYEAYGLCHDTVIYGTSFSIGGNAGDAGLIPFWTCKFITPEGELTSNLLTLLGENKKQISRFEDTLVAFGGNDLLADINAAIHTLKSQAMPNKAHGKVVIFPLGSGAIKSDEYLAITPVPSAAMILRFSERFFAELSAQKAHNVLAKKTNLEPRQFNFPRSQNVNIVASNAANGGSAIQSIKGVAKAFKAVVGSLSIEDRLGKDGFLVRKLQSGRGSLLSINNVTLDFLGRSFKFGKVEQHWKGRLTDVLSSVIEPLQSLRQQGLPSGVVAEEARFRFSVERRFVLRTMGGDLGKRTLTTNDIHELSQHVCDRLQQAMIQRDNDLGMSIDRQALVYQSLFDLLG